MDILLVEDSQTDARLLKELLRNKENAPNVHWVTDGHQALDYVMNRHAVENGAHPHVIVLDLGLPRVNGYSVLRKLKDDPRFAQIPIVILTTSRNPIDIAQCRELGADMFLSKPRSLQGFEELAEQLMRDEFPRLAAA